LPVCPYAKQVALVRWKISGTIGSTVSEYTYGRNKRTSETS